MLTLDRYLGFHFFTNEAGGNVMMFVNLIWAWGHPEVYILILPAMGIASEILPVFSRKPVFGYHAMAFSMIVPRAIVTLPVRPPMLENSSGLRLISWDEPEPE